MRIYYRTGVELSAGTLRLELPGVRPDGRTGASDLKYLMRRHGLRPTGGQVASYTLLRKLIAATSEGTPPIVLGYWLSPQILHWLLVVGATSTGVVVNDPWDGTRYPLPHDTLLTRYAGLCIL